MFAKNSVSEAQLLKINDAIHAYPKTHGKFSPPTCRVNADTGAADLLTRIIRKH